MNYKEAKSKICPSCNKEFNYSKKSQKLCPICVSNKISFCTKHNHIHDTTKLCPQCLVEKSHIKFPEGSEYLECKICTYRAKELTNHIIKQHNITPEQYKIDHNVKVLKVQSLCDSVKGDKNPGFNHGGRLSPFSEKFIKYTNNEDYQNGLETVKSKSIQTKTDHPENENTKIDYYLAQGYSQDEAEVMLSERQTTFSLSKCIERYGEDEGLIIWKQRQEKWLCTLSSKSKEEIDEINRKKSSSISFGSLWNQSDNQVNGVFYLIQIDDNHVKIGITSKSIKKRYSKLLTSRIKLSLNTTLNKAFMYEQVLKHKLKDYKIKPEEVIGEFGWTETFRTESDIVINIINTIKDVDLEFKEIYDR